MSARPAPVHIDDLAEPRYSDEVRAILDFMEEAGSQLALEPARAHGRRPRRRPALDDFGPARLRGPARRAVPGHARARAASTAPASCSSTPSSSGCSRTGSSSRTWSRRHPEILDEQIAAPIIICGLPRTGTTHLHNLMSADPALRSLPYWESLEPVLAERERPAPGAPDPRLERTAMALSFLDAAMPYFNRMHEMTVEHTHEEIQLLAIDFSTMLFETTAPMPLWRDDYLARDQRPSYAYLRKVLQVLQWLRGGTRWVLKSPQHLEQFPALVETFPDATFVVTHRDPVSVTASMVTMLAYSARLTRDRVDVEGIGRYWADRLERMLRPLRRGARRPARQTRPSTSTSTSSWPTTWPWWGGSTSWPASRSTRAPGPPWRRSWPRTRGAGSAPSSTTWRSSAWTPAERRRALSFYTERFGVTSES